MHTVAYPATLLCDFYKVSHREQYPKGTQFIYSTWTPRTSRIPGIQDVVFFGLQAFVKKYLIDYFNKNFFSRPVYDVLYEYERIIEHTLGVTPDTRPLASLHKLGYLPLKIKAVEEGSRIPLRVPMLTIENTHPDFFWVTNYIETLLSCSLWQPCTNATIAHEYKKLLMAWAEKTGGDKGFVQFQGHDFSMRGMASLEAAQASGAAHLLSFTGTDSIPGILFLEEYYGANVEKGLVGTSIPATEHSVMCAHGRDELETYRKLITEVYPRGFVSIVSDTWDLWKVIREVLVPLKDIILSREGKVVIRPDSGNPVDILCGKQNDPKHYDEYRGVVELLYEIFGGRVNEKGYKELDPHIGVIYGDAITLDRCKAICERLEEKGFASTNVVYGIGSYTYQHNTRDTFGFALKSTYAEIDGEPRFLIKDPVTDKGIKKSQTGMVMVSKNDTGIYCQEGLTRKEAQDDYYQQFNLLETVFENGKLFREETLAQIRSRL